MTRMLALFGLSLLAACDTYDEYSRLADQDGLAKADQFARYNREAAQKIAIGRKLAEVRRGESTEELAQQARAAMQYAQTLPDVVGVEADVLGHWLTIQFRSGWRVAVLPIDDGTEAEETVGLPAAR